MEAATFNGNKELGFTEWFQEQMVRHVDLYYNKRRLDVVPIHFGTKVPASRNWTNELYRPEHFHENHAPKNVGLKLGWYRDRNAALTDIDLDSELARTYAKFILPETMKHGRVLVPKERPGNPYGLQRPGQITHYWYWLKFNTPARNSFEPIHIRDASGGTLFEVRSKRGLQTVVPPSAYLSDQPDKVYLLVYEKKNGETPEIMQIDEEQFKVHICALGITCLIDPHFKRGVRHHISLGLAGWLSKLKIEPQHGQTIYELIMNALSQYHQDGQQKEYEHNYQTTLKKYERERIGQLKLKEILGEQTYKAIETLFYQIFHDRVATLTVNGEPIIKPQKDFQVDIPIPIIPHIAYKNSITVLAGPPGVGKTTLVAYFTQQLLKPKPQIFGLHAKPARVLWIDTDQSFEQVNRLFKNVYDVETSNLYAANENYPLPALNQETFALYQTILEEYEIDLIIVDTLADWLNPKELNSDDDARKQIQLLRTLIKPTETSVLLIHHTNKSNNQHPTRTIEKIAGSSRYTSKSDVVILLTYQEGKEPEPQTTNPTRTNLFANNDEPLILRIIKNRFAPRLDIPIIRKQFRFEPENNVPDDLVNSALFFVTHVTPPPTIQQLTQHLKNHGHPVSENIIQKIIQHYPQLLSIRDGKVYPNISGR